MIELPVWLQTGLYLAGAGATLLMIFKAGSYHGAKQNGFIQWVDLRACQKTRDEKLNEIGKQIDQLHTKANRANEGIAHIKGWVEAQE